jgi:hypothetical protein
MRKRKNKVAKMKHDQISEPEIWITHIDKIAVEWKLIELSRISRPVSCLVFWLELGPVT